MKSKCMVMRRISSWMMIVFYSVFLVSCSTDNFIKKIRLWDESVMYVEAEDKDVERFVSSVRTARGNPHSHYLLAKHYQNRGMHKAAIEEFNKIMLIDPLYAKAYNGIGVSLDKLGQTYRAADYYKNALILDPGLDYVLNNLGYAYIRLGKYDEAIDALKKALEINDHNRYHNNLGLAYGRKGDFEQAFVEFHLGGGEVKAHYNLGQVYYEKEYYYEARFHFEKALNLDPSFVIAKSWYDLADSMAAIYHSSDEKSANNDVTTSSLKHLYADSMGGTVKLPKKKHTDIFNDSGNAMSETAHPQSGDRTKEKQIATDNVSYKGVGVEISNGNGVYQMARRVGKFLTTKGFDVVRLTNADNFAHNETVVYYRGGYLETAHEIVKQIPGSYNMDKVHAFDRSNIDIKVLIGKDVVKYNNEFSGG